MPAATAAAHHLVLGHRHREGGQVEHLHPGRDRSRRAGQSATAAPAQDGSTGSRLSGVATGARPLPRCPGCPPCLRRARPAASQPPRMRAAASARPAGQPPPARLRLGLRARPVRARRLRGVRGVPAHLPPQRLQLDPQRLDQHRLLGQLGGLLGHQSRQLPIRGRRRRLGHRRSQT